MKLYDVASTSPSFPTVQLILTALVTVLNGGFHFGFHISIVNPMATVLQDFLLEGKYNIEFSDQATKILWSFVASEVLIGALFGATYVTKMVEAQGPLKALYQASIMQFSSLFLLSASGFILSPVLFIISRLFSGFSVGMAVTAQGIFLTEISPGKIGTLGGLSTNIGFILAATLGLPYILGTKEHWPVIFLLEAIPCMLFIVSSCFWLKESPLYYVRNGQAEQAKEAILCYYGNEKNSRMALLISVAVNIAVSFSGITAVSFFGTLLLRSMGFSEFFAATANLLCSLSGTVGALLATVGSRMLILSGLVLLVLLDSLMMLFVYIYSITQQEILGWIFLSVFIMFLFSFSIGIGPAAWSIGAEISPIRSRSKVQSIAVGTHSLPYGKCLLSTKECEKNTDANGNKFST